MTYITHKILLRLHATHYSYILKRNSRFVLITTSIYCLLFLAGFYAASRERHVTHTGRDTSTCGQNSMPCQTIRYAVRISSAGDTILVDYAGGRAYNECESSSPISIKDSLTIQGINGSAEIQCRENTTLFLIKQSRVMRRLTLLNLILSNSEVAVNCLQSNVNLVFNECILRNNSVGISIKKAVKCFLVVNNSSFHNHQSAGIESFPCETSNFKITNTSFYSSQIIQSKQQYDAFTERYELLINNCSFLGKGLARQRFRNGIVVYAFANTTKIIIDKTIFKNHLGLNPNERLLWIKETYGSTKQKTTFITLNEMIFENNYLKKNLIFLEAARGKEYSVFLENSLFKNNTGTIEFAISPFNANEYVLNRDRPNDTFLLRKNTFLGNRYFPRQGLDGIYATLFFNCGSFQVDSCKFIDNHHGQGPSTGVISMSDMANVTLNDCYFEIGKVNGTAIQVFAYPKSLLTIVGNNTLNITKLNDAKTIFIHLPSNKLANLRAEHYGSVVMIGTLHFICPQGFSITQQKVKKLKQQQNDTAAFSFFQASCWPCPRKSYSLDRGEAINYQNTTMIGCKSSPRDNMREFRCHECPRGGHCVLGFLQAKADFWGYRIGDKVRFIDCPHDYCCDRHHCPTYNTCHNKRTGRLCGRCPSGTSESLFTTACRKNNKCTAVIFIPAAAVLTLAYIIFFLYHNDIELFLFSGFPVKLPSLLDRDDSEESSGCIKIIFYYYQTVDLLMSSVGFEEKLKVLNRINDLISQVFNMIVANISSFDCPFPNMTPVSKTLISHSLGFVLLFILGMCCLIMKLCHSVRKRNRIQTNSNISSLNPLIENDSDTENVSVNNHRSRFYEVNERADPQDSPKTSFVERALRAFTHICLLMYSATARLCLRLLRCVPYKNKTKLLFIDGTMHCYQIFQYVLLGYGLISVLPFCMVPFLGSYVLKLGLISVTQFFLGCLLPLPFCCYWLLLLLRNRADVNEYHMPHESAIHRNRLAILHVLSGPFRKHEAVACFPHSRLAWESVLILRRLVLILIFAFVYDRRWRTLSALIACVLILVIHLHVRPFRKRWENFLETASLTTLVAFCGFTLVKALYRGEDYSSLYTNSTFMYSLNIIESTLIIAPLAVIVSVLFMLLSFKLVRLFGMCFRKIRSLFSVSQDHE